jgi:8-oxo-dGTP pyrophosphatase MutT (NUDIX family)
MVYKAGNVLASRAALQNDAGELLLLKRTPEARHNPERWEFPGGGAVLKPRLDQTITDGKLHELLEDDVIKTYFNAYLGATAIRETWEETGLEVFTRPPLIMVEQRQMDGYEDRKAIYLAFCSPAALRAGENQIRLSEEHTAFAWEPFETAMAYDLTPQTQMAAEKLEPHLRV